MALSSGQSGHLSDHQNGVYTVSHGATAGTARPTLGSSGTAPTRVLWDGSVTPSNAVDGDLWWDSDKRLVKHRVGGVFVSQFSGVLLTKSATQSIPNGVSTDVGWGTLVYEIGHEYFDAASSTTDVTIPETGKYEVGVSVAFATNTTGRRVVRVERNTSSNIIVRNDSPPVTGGYTSMLAAAHRSLTAGDVLTVSVFQNSGGALDIDSDGSVNGSVAAFWVRRLDA